MICFNLIIAANQLTVHGLEKDASSPSFRWHPKLPLQVLVFDYETEGSQTIVYTRFHIVYSSVFFLVLIIHNDIFFLLKIIY
jgi:hypothetical protein